MTQIPVKLQSSDNHRREVDQVWFFSCQKTYFLHLSSPTDVLQFFIAITLETLDILKSDCTSHYIFMAWCVVV